MRLLAPILLCSLLTAPAAAQEVHIAHCLKGCPTGTAATNDLIIPAVVAPSSHRLLLVAPFCGVNRL